MKNLKTIISLLVLSSLLTGCGSIDTDEKLKVDDVKTTTATTEANEKVKDKDEDKDDEEATTEAATKANDGKVKVTVEDDDDDETNIVKVEPGKVKVDLGGIKVNVDGDDDDSDSVKVNIGGIKVNIGNGAEYDSDVDVDIGDIDIDLSDYSFGYAEKLTDKNEYSFNTDPKITDLGIDINTGDIDIKYSDDDKTKVTLGYTIYADDKKTCEDVKKHIKAVSETKDGSMNIDIVDSDSDDEFDKWLKINFPKCRIKYDIVVEVPLSINGIYAKSDVGNISLEELKGGFSCYSNVGSINCMGLEFSEPSEISSKTGSIKITSSKYTADTDISSKTGNITMDMPVKGSEKADISVSASTGNIKMNSSKSYEVNDESKKAASHSMNITSENCNIDLSVKTGKITIDKE